MDDLSRAYIEKHGKIAVASSDGHRPNWVHSFFTRFDRAIENTDDAIEQLRAGQVTPMASDTAYHAACAARWQRREIVEWHESGKDWRAMATAAGYEPEDAEGRLALYQQVKGLAGRGATPAEVAGETGLSLDDAMDYLGVVEEESEFAAQWRV